MTATAKTITITRLFDAPRALVFECWLKPEHLVHWHSAGDGWTTPYAQSDGRTAGASRSVLPGRTARSRSTLPAPMIR